MSADLRIMSADLRIGIAGTGAIGKTHIERINTRLRGGKVVAATDASPTFGKATAEQYNLEFFPDCDSLVASKKIDALIVTAADDDHERFVTSALKANLPVFCEKPLAPTADACKRIIDLETSIGKRLVQVGFMRRYDPGYRELKRLVDSGEFGAPLMLHCAHRNFSVADNYTTPMAITSTLIHEIDVLRWLIGEDYATVEMILPKASKHARANLHDPQIMILTSASGIRMDVEAHVTNRTGYDIQCEVCCEEGYLKLPELPTVPRLRHAQRATPICRDWSERFVEAYNIEIQEWMDSTKKGRVDGPNAWDGYAACVCADAAQQSREQKTAVPVALPPTPAFYSAGAF